MSSKWTLTGNKRKQKREKPLQKKWFCSKCEKNKPIRDWNKDSGICKSCEG